MRVVGIVAPFAALGVGTCGKFVLSNPGVSIRGKIVLSRNLGYKTRGSPSG